MTELDRISDLEPGSLIVLSDITQMADFENQLAVEIDPEATEYNRDAWLGRMAVKDLLKPPKFHGPIMNVELVVMPEPYERFLDANERGWKMGTGAPRRRSEDAEFTGSFRGFTFLADGVSSGRGVRGQVQAELWYSRVPTRKTLSRAKSNNVQQPMTVITKKTANTHAGAVVQRFTTVPRLSNDKFEGLREESMRIGFEILRDNMRNPISKPFHS